MNRPRVCILLCAFFAFTSVSWGATIWIEGEQPASNRTTRHPWWYDKVKTEELSGGDFISNWDKDKAGELEYRVDAAAAGNYEFWVRANPIQAAMTYSINGSTSVPIAVNRNEQSINIAADDKPDMRFIAWVKVGNVSLKQGTNTVKFTMTSTNNHHGMLDCFVLSTEPFQPNGKLKPGEGAPAQEGKWFAFNPPPDNFAESAIDLRSLNEKFAGEL
ncbi:MAG TPA: hypothetical protein VK530_12370, partial [Candidatus Acidoferrum sp.]|nr:hypothetical protein [Candidatus Acidoferrum sp.]